MVLYRGIMLENPFVILALFSGSKKQKKKKMDREGRPEYIYNIY